MAQQIYRIRPDGTRRYDIVYSIHCSTLHGRHTDGKTKKRRRLLLGNLMIHKIF